MLISSAQHATYFSGNLQLKCRGEVRSPDRQSTVEPQTNSQEPTAKSRFFARHRRPTAHARARYRCFLPDLAGLAGRRRAGPMPDNLILASSFASTAQVPSSPSASLGQVKIRRMQKLYLHSSQGEGSGLEILQV